MHDEGQDRNAIAKALGISPLSVHHAFLPRPQAEHSWTSGLSAQTKVATPSSSRTSTEQRDYTGGRQ
jgi:hypothetical protein